MKKYYENFIFDTMVPEMEQKSFVLVIYDISENTRRNKLVKLLEGYGFRVQKSAFESRLSERQYQKLLCDIDKFAKENDNIRIYKINGQGEIHSYGIKQDKFENEVLIL